MKEADQIILDIRRKILKPGYLLNGEEPYYIDQISNVVEHELLDEAEKGFNQTVVYGKDVQLSDIIGLARQFPMSGDLSVVLVKEAQGIREFNKKGSDDEDAKESKGAQLLVDYLKSPTSTTLLMFCYKYGTLDKRSAIYKAFQKNGLVFQSDKIYDSKLPEWITERITSRGYKAGPRTISVLAEYLGNDLSKIVNETDKLYIGIPPGSEITLERVQEKIGISKDFNVFELQSALTARDVVKANRIIHYFSANEKENPLPLTLGMLYSYFVKVLKVHGVPDRNKFTVAQALGVNPYFSEEYLTAAAAFPPAKLRRVFAYLKECDLKSKGIENDSIPNGALLQELIFKILH